MIDVNFVLLFFTVEGNRRRSRRLQTVSPPGAYFLLQLHDELIYEVNSSDTDKVAKVISNCMENAMNLSVTLPVKVKVGPSWGSLEDLRSKDDH